MIPVPSLQAAPDGRLSRRLRTGLLHLWMWVSTVSRWAILLTLPIMRSHIAAGQLAEVTFGGCEVVRVPQDRDHPEGIACELWGASLLESTRGGDNGRSGTEQETVTLWTSAVDPFLAVAVDGEPRREVRWVPVTSTGEEGWRARVSLRRPAHELTVSGSHGPILRLPLLPAEDPEGQRAFREALDARRNGDLDRARALAEDLLRHTESPSLQAKALGLLARLERAADPETALSLLERAIAIHRAGGRLSGETNDVVVQAYIRSVQKGRLDEAARDLRDLEVRGVVAGFPEGRAVLPYYRSVIAAIQGDLDRAYHDSTQAERLALHLDMQGTLEAVHLHQLSIQDRSGDDDGDETATKSEAERPPADQPCALAHYYNNLGLHRLNAAGRSDAPDDEYARADLDLKQAQAIFSTNKCQDDCEWKNVLVNRAHGALDHARLLRETGEEVEDADRQIQVSRRVQEAEDHLERARLLCPHGPVRYNVEWSLYAGRAAQASGQRDAEAGAHLDKAIRLSHPASLPYHEVAALVARAELAEKTNEDHAIQLYSEAEDTLDRWSDLARSDGKRAFFAHYDGGVRRYLDLLARRLAKQGLGDEERRRRVRVIACVARRSMARALRSSQRTQKLIRTPGPVRDAYLDFEKERLDIEEEARQYADATDAPTERKLDKLARRAADAADRIERAVTDLPGAPPVSAPTCEGAQAPPPPGEVVLVFPPKRGSSGMGIFLSATEARLLRFPSEQGELTKLLDAHVGSRIRIHAVEPVGSFLSEPALQRRFVVTHGVDLPPLDVAPPVPQRALVVIPDLNIPLAKQQEGYVRAALPGWKVEVLSDSDATLPRLKEELEKGYGFLLVYAHGTADDRPNRDGWATRILLHGRSWLTARDAPTLPRMPPVVVLAICNGAATRGRAYVQGPSLAHGLLIAGARWVIASPEEILDADVDRVMKRVYAHPGAIVADPASAFHDAVAEIPSKSDWPLPTLRVLSR